MKDATLYQAVKLLEVASQKRTPAEQMQALLASGLFADLLDANFDEVDRDTVRVALGLAKLVPDVVITELSGIVLPARPTTFGDRQAAGGYDWTDSEFTEANFPLTLPAGPRPLVTAWFQRDVSLASVTEWAEPNGYELALTDDLLAVGAHPEYRELQRQFPMVAGGSSAVIHGHRFVPYLHRSGVERDLSLDWYDSDFHAFCRFLLVRKVVKPLVCLNPRHLSALGPLPAGRSF